MKEFSSVTRIYIFSTGIIGVVLLALFLPDVGWTSPGMYILAGLAALGQALKLEGPTERSHYNLGWLIYGFAIVYLDLASALFVVLIAHLVEWLWHKYPWYIQTFNIGAYIISMTAAITMYNWMNPIESPLYLTGAVAIILSMAGFTLLNHLLVGVIIKLARGQSFAESGVFDGMTLMIDFALLGMGAATALVWVVNPYAAILNIIPLYLIHNALKVPSLQRKVEMANQGGD